MSTHEPGGAGPPDESPEPIEELAHTATDDVVEGELLDDGETEIVIDAGDELTRLAAERDEYLAHLQRTQAEFDNYRKRMLRDQTTHLERATAGLIEQLLPVLDAFELALGSASAPRHAAPKSCVSKPQSGEESPRKAPNRPAAWSNA